MNRWRQIESLFQEALQRPVEERDVWLREACAGDADLHREVASLLANHHDGTSAEGWPAAAAQLIIKPVFLEPGQYVGPYQITSFLAAGGMGEVYRARDTTLKRDVALKVLPEAFARDPARMTRFQREAEVLASLNHPNIAHIYGIEERALVMEFVEGESPKGPMSFEEAAKIAVQMADALEYAHEKGVVHRDLKPANIKITAGGTLKLLDFGLAKAFAPDCETTARAENLPTVTIPETEPGVVLGTAAYMSPEQASGKPVDKRADIWSYGVVLWELLTGERLFHGETMSHTLADVLRAPIDFSKLPKETAVPICELLRRCFDRDVKNRLRDIGEARVALQKYLANPGAGVDTDEVRSPVSGPLSRSLLPWCLAGVLFVSTAVFLALWFLRPTPPRLVSQFTIEAPRGTEFTSPVGSTAVSPDGRFVVFSAISGSDSRLWLRALDSPEARPLPETEGANFPFWSSDSRSIAFFADYKLKRIDLQSGAPLVLCPAPERLRGGVGGTWNRNGVILFGGNTGLRRVSASGGEPALLTKIDASRQETGHGFPQFLSDGNRFLYFVESGDPSVEGVYAASLDNPEQRVLVLKAQTKAVYTEQALAGSEYLLWLREHTLFAQRFDSDKLRLEGDPVAVVQGINVNANQHRAGFWASDAGVLVYRATTALPTKIAWIRRDGTHGEEFQVFGDFPPGISPPQLSPDGKRAAFSRVLGGPSLNLWAFEFSRSAFTRLTSGDNTDSDPIWSPDNRQVAFSSNRTGLYQIYRKDADGLSQEEQLTSGPNNKRVTSWSRDDKFLLYSQDDPKTNVDIWALPLDHGRKPIPIVQTSYDELKAQFSPDGKWIAYESNETGQFEVYICAFPSTAGKHWPISNRGGTDPRWSGDGKELFYLSGGKVMAMPIRISAAGVEEAVPHELFSVLPFPTQLVGDSQTARYDVSYDGQRFIFLEPAEGATAIPPLTVLVNWDARLKK